RFGLSGTALQTKIGSCEIVFDVPHSRLEATWRIERQETCADRSLILEVVRRPARNDYACPLGHVRPVIVEAQAQGAGKDIIDMILGMEVHARSARMRLEPPFRHRVATGRFIAVGFEDRAHWT